MRRAPAAREAGAEISVETPVALPADLGAEFDTLCAALLSLGLEGVSVATGYSEDGHAEGAEPYQPG